jgi:hypothetical protein
MSWEKTVWPRFTPHCRHSPSHAKASSDAIFDGKKLKSKNLETMPNCHALKILAGIENSCPGQSWYGINGAFLRIKGIVPPSSEGRP